MFASWHMESYILKKDQSMNAYRAKYHNGTLRLVEKPPKRPKTENAIVIFLGEDIQPTRALNKKQKQQRPYALCKNDFSVTSAFDDTLPLSFMKAFSRK
jgi:hypothetical protein